MSEWTARREEALPHRRRHPLEPGRAKPPAEPRLNPRALLDRCLQSIGSAPTDGGLEEVADWKATALILLRHGLGPLASMTLTKEEAPREVLDSLRWTRTRALLIHKAALGLLGRMDGLFGEAGLDYAVLKGPHLYEDLYREQFPRPYSDIDLLVHSGNVDRALEVLRPLGYDEEGGRFTRLFMRHGHFHLVLVNRKAELPKIELHWSLVDRANLYRIRDEEVLARAVRRSSSAGDFSVLNNEDTLIYLAVHVAKHGLLNTAGLRRGYDAQWFCGDMAENRLLWFIDIDLLIRKHAESMDWAAVAERCREWNCVEDVVTTLMVMKALLPESAADLVLEHLEAASPAGETFLERMLLTERGMRVFERSMRMHRKLVFRPARLLVGIELLFPPPARMKAYYGVKHGWVLPFFYLRHPFHIVRKQIS